MNPKYRTAHNSWDPNFVFPLPVNRHRHDKIFIDPIWGIKIERIFVGRSPVPAEDFRARLDDLNFNKVPIGSEPFIYLVRRSHFVFAKTFDDRSYDLEKYSIPMHAPVVLVEYRLRESNDSFGPVMTLESVLV